LEKEVTIMKIYTGTSGYSYKEWKGNFYPEKFSAEKMLSYYSGKLTAVEINNTYYRMPKINVVMSWANQVPSGFMFAVKAPQIITHIKRLNNVGEETKYFLTIISSLGKKLGTVLFQFPASFKKDIPLLENFLKHIPPKIPCAFDFRSPSWFDVETYELLNRRKFSLCLEDTDEKPVTELINTATWGYLRLRRSNYTDLDLSTWSEKVLSQKWKRAFIFFKHEDDEAAKGPSFAGRFKEICQKIEIGKTILTT
jgi:uncharacterized protein YecE (DUF72 family)